MTKAYDSMMEFAEAVWADEKELRKIPDIYDLVQEIYGYYNYKNEKRTPGWTNILPLAAWSFASRCGDLEFKLQGKDLTATGAEIGEAISAVQKLAEAPNADVRSAINKARQDASSARKEIKRLVRKLQKKVNSSSITLGEAQTQLQNYVPTNKPPTLKTDPAYILKSFCWNYARPHKSSAYRIYVTPFLRDAASVYCEFIRFINGRDPVEGIDHLAAPPRGKLGIPGADEGNRIDRIVIYCDDKDQMEVGLDWFRHYQKSFPLKFMNKTPRSTAPVEGLRGVAITLQPQADAAEMKKAGINKVKGMSFGMSRSAVLALALKQSNSLPNFKQNVDTIAQRAGLKLELEDLST